MYELPPLGYSYDALEPHIDALTMEIHHTKHHKTYVEKLNKAIENTEYATKTNLKELLQNIEKLPKEIQNEVRNNGGGHANHMLFWNILTPGGSKKPQGELLKAIEKKFGSLEDFKKELSETAIKRFGSGWAWLVQKSSGDLELYSLPNQDSPYMQLDKPILGIDVWEHAYYLKYQNKRPDYLKAVIELINYDRVHHYFQAQA